MSYIALYRSYRPKFFKEVVGQKVIVKTLQNALSHDKIGHAYIFSGPRGTGKTSVAKILAKAVNCLNYPINEPCGKCANCLGIASGEIGDIIEIDAASNNGVDEIREIRDKAKYLPSVGRYKVYIIDEVHMLTTGAFNALLKTLEEPPKHVIFILATTEIHKIPPTILSRCQRFDFKNIDEKDIAERVKEICEIEKIKINDDAIEAISLNAEGGLRDALSLLDQVISFSDGTITQEDVHNVAGSLSSISLSNLLLAIYNKESSVAINILDDLIENGKEITRIISDLIIALRDCLLEKELVLEKNKYFNISNLLSVDKIYFYIDILNKLQNDIKNTQQKRAYIEVAIFKMINHKIVHEIDQTEMILNLKKDIESLKDDMIKRPKVVSKEKDAKTPLVTVDDIALVLYSGDKDKRISLKKGWDKLKDYPDTNLKSVAKLLSKSDLVAISKDKMVLVYDNLLDCKAIMDKDVKKDVFKIINARSNLINDYYAIIKSDWDILRTVFENEYDPNKNPRPILPMLDLKLYKEEKKDIKKAKPDTVLLAVEYFGEDKVKIKGE
ncbi:DNA polymerase III subunit gamma/tau [Acholeplasma sp. OttesenSCG-928-E16]|nr:DNA polymerase III subunit gamma/tau [Acholeplasma sp. OttesenSCG-928-E16]